MKTPVRRFVFRCLVFILLCGVSVHAAETVRQPVLKQAEPVQDVRTPVIAPQVRVPVSPKIADPVSPRGPAPVLREPVIAEPKIRTGAIPSSPVIRAEPAAPVPSGSLGINRPISRPGIRVEVNQVQKRKIPESSFGTRLNEGLNKETTVQKAVSAGPTPVPTAQGGETRQLAQEMQQLNQDKADLREEIAEMRDEINELPQGDPRREDMENLLDDMEEELNSMSDLSQQLQLDLQVAMNKQQQAMQILSNIMKNQHDTLKAIIQNMR